ncbi:MAG: hypothetical protein Q4G69_03035 [Planctomycetia bacterium]|nr:hypothetical protein [Planctomycetia bacterium]
MKNNLFLIALILSSSMMLGCVCGYGTITKDCNDVMSRDSGRLTDGYTPSDNYAYRSFGLGTGVGMMFNQVEPYEGAPVYVVNNSAELYGTNYYANGQYGGYQMADTNGMYSGFGGYYTNRMGHHKGVFERAGHHHGAYMNHSFGPFQRGLAARRTKSSMSQSDFDQMGRPNTPTRSPRDFFAPNPPSIGP